MGVDAGVGGGWVLIISSTHSIVAVLVAMSQGIMGVDAGVGGGCR